MVAYQATEKRFNDYTGKPPLGTDLSGQLVIDFIAARHKTAPTKTVGFLCPPEGCQDASCCKPQMKFSVIKKEISRILRQPSNLDHASDLAGMEHLGSWDITDGQGHHESVMGTTLPPSMMSADRIYRPKKRQEPIRL